MFVLLVKNASGAILYVYIFSSAANAQAAQTAAQGSIPAGWTTTILNTPATDTAWGNVGGLA